MKKKNIAVVVSSLVIGAVTLGALTIPNNGPSDVLHVSSMPPAPHSAVAVGEFTFPSIDPILDVPEVAVSESVPIVETETTPSQPTVKSVDELAYQYLNMSVPRAKECLDKTVSMFPERFTEDVREKNIRAMRVFRHICVTGVLYTDKTPLGQQGEFFDSDLAKANQ